MHGDICAICCGTERENTVRCPLDCEYLIEARRHEKSVPVDVTKVPNRDVEVTEEFLHEHDPLLALMSAIIYAGAKKTEGSTDRDVREALEATIKTLRTAQSGLIYETRPENPYAAEIQEFIKSRLDQFREAMAKEQGMTTLRDAEVLGVLVFLQRLAIHWDNGRPLGRSFLSFLHARHTEAPPSDAPEESDLTGGDSPLIVG